MSPAGPHRVLVYHIGSLGDTLMALPALWSVRSLWPEARLALLTKQTPSKHVLLASAVLTDTGLFDQVIAYPGTRHGGDTWWQRLRQAWLLVRVALRRFDTVVYLAPTEREPRQVARDERFFRWAGIARRIGFGDPPLPPSRTVRPLTTLASEADMLLERLRREGLPVPALDSARTDCAVSAAELQAVDDWVGRQSGPAAGPRRWLAIAPGSNMPAKQWPLERYAEVTRSLVREFDLWPVIFGGPEDAAAARALQAAIGCGHVATGELTPRESAAALRRCALYLGNDTGTMHLAASERVPCVVPFSARDFPGKWHPIGAGHAVIRLRLDCEGCMKERCEDRAMQCLMDISETEVLAHARGLLQGGKAAPGVSPAAASFEAVL